MLFYHRNYTHKNKNYKICYLKHYFHSMDYLRLLHLKDKIDFGNVSLNASCVEKYQPICRSQYGESGFAGMIEFAKLCRRNGVPCRFSIVDCIGEDEVEACKRLAESIKIPLYVRKYITDS